METINTLPEGETFHQTNNLRFVRRDKEVNFGTLSTAEILQQEWRGDKGGVVWKDVPLEGEF